MKILIIALSFLLSTNTASFAEKVVVVPLGGTTNIMASINWKGEWSVSESYQNGDAVESEGSSYLCAGEPDCIMIPPAGSWDLMAAKGLTGADSTVPGPIGPPGADSIVPGPPGADSIVPGPEGPQGPPGPVAGTNGQFIYNNKGEAAGANIFYSNGSVGIGTGEPGSMLEVSGTIHSTLDGFKFPDGSTQRTGITRLDDLSDGKSDGMSVFLGWAAGTNDDNNHNSNTGIGAYALNSNTSGFSNTAVGLAALENNDNADGNTAIGVVASRYNTTGSSNVAVGAEANLYNQQGHSNTIVGSGAGRGSENHDKHGNVMLGHRAGYTNTGSYNIFLGYKAGYNESGSNKLYIENSDSASPLIGGDFSTNTIVLNGNVGIGTQADTGKQLNVVGGATDAYVGYFKSEDSNESAFGVQGVADGVTNRGVEDVHYGVYGVAKNARTNYGLVGNAIDANATVNYGIYGYASGGTTYAGFFDGNLAYTGSLINASDRRLKENITPLEDPLAKLDDINGVYYTMKDNPEEVRIGVIAQDVEKVLPEAVSIIDPENGYLGVNYTSLIPLLVEAMKTLKSENEALKALVCLEHLDASICQN